MIISSWYANKGVDPGFHSVPLHHINIKPDTVLGQVVVGVQPTFPVEDISFLFGIYMAGDKVNDHMLHSDGPSLIDLWSWTVSRWDV
jgi:hypothetical protein